MMNEERERQFRVRPPRTRRTPGDEGEVWSLAFKRMMHIVRMTSRRKSSSTGVAKRIRRPSMQRCAVRVTYAPNRTRGQWAAHGRYIARESAVHSDTGNMRAFGPSGPVSDIHLTLGSWQKSGDPRLFKLIISPEFGEGVDLERLTRDLIAAMEQDLGTHFEWVATAHHNTEHPHVHVALRGFTPQKKAVFFPRSYIQHGIRQHAEELTTAQLGPRTLSDTREAQRREVEQLRYTSLDQTLQRHDATAGNSASSSAPEGSSFIIDLRKALPTVQLHHLKARLLFLEKLDLVKTTGSNQWLVRSDFEPVLRAIGQTRDRQRALAAHRALLSDERLPFSVTDATKIDQPLEGRVIGHGEDESSGRVYMLLEGTDGRVHFIYHNREIEEARHGGRLKPNSFARLKKQSMAGKTLLGIFDYGDAHKLLTNTSYLKNKAQIFVEREIVPVEKGWGGWLGQYETALTKNFQNLQKQKARSGPTR